MESNYSSSFSLYLMLILSTFLICVDVMELNSLVSGWRKEMQFKELFEECIKWELMTKTTFSVFSLVSALSAASLTFLILLDSNLFLEKLLSTYLYFNYMIFGPVMLGFSVLALCYWNDVMWTCDKNNFHHKVLAYSNIFSVCGSLIISTIITFLISFYQTLNLFVDSTKRKPEGSPILRKAFWFVVLKNRNASDLIRQAQINSERSPSNV